MRVVETSFVVAIFTATALAQIQGPQMPAGAGTPGLTRPPQPAATDAMATLHGRVVIAETGKPLHRARIRIDGTGNANGGLAREAFTNRDGHYRFENLVPGRYMVHSSRPGFIEMQSGQKHPNDAGDSQQIAAGQSQQLDFALPRGSVISGRLTDELGEPLAGVQVVPLRFHYSGNGARLQPLYSALSSRTDDRGAFRVVALRPGTYVLAADTQNNGTGEGHATSYYPGTRSLAEARRFHVGLNDEITASFSMTTTRQVRVTGQVRSTEKPLQSYQVLLRTNTGLGTKTARLFDGTGTFEFDGVSPGNYILDVIRFRMNDPAPGNPDEFASVPIEIGEEDVTGLLIVTGFGTTVSGRVIYEGTAPRNSTSRPSRVHTSVVEQPYGARMRWDHDTGVISEDGTFILNGTHGKVVFRVSMSPEWQLRAVMLDGADITDVPYDATRGGVERLEIFVTDQQQELKGIVVDASGKPATSGFTIVVFPSVMKDGAVPGRFVRVMRHTQSTGPFGSGNLPPGDYFAVALRSLPQDGGYDPEWHEAIKPRATPFIVSPGRDVELKLVLVD